MLMAHISRAFDQIRHGKLLGPKINMQKLKPKGLMLKYGISSSPPNARITVTNLTMSYPSLQKLFSVRISNGFSLATMVPMLIR